MLGFLLAFALIAPSATQASDKTLKAAMAKWSHTIAVDAHGIGLAAARRHPRRMTYRAKRFRADAVRARRAITAQKASSAKGRRARRLALAAFRDYAVVGSQWMACGQARLRGRKTLAVRHAKVAKRYAIAGNRLLLSAGRVLR